MASSSYMKHELSEMDLLRVECISECHTTTADVSMFCIEAFACVLVTNEAYSCPGNGAVSSVNSASPVH